MVALAVAATWGAARLRIPSIVLLLAGGVLVGPVLQLLDPDALLGDLLTPSVSLAVGLILFEGGLSLRFRDIKGNLRVVWPLVTVGVAITWALGAWAANVFLGLSLSLAILIGAILTVSGPTVVGPILNSVRPRRAVSSVLRWESIVIDPIGAMLAVVAFEVVLAGSAGSAEEAFLDAARFAAVGVAAGAVMSLPTIWAIRRHLIPERLVPLVGLAAAVVAFAISDYFAQESGLLATTVLGLILANSKRLRTEPLISFSETLQVLLVGVLFILLSARLTRDELTAISFGVIGLIAVLVVVARPLGVAASTLFSDLTRKEKVFLAGVAPRGIVAAAVASVFSLELVEAGVSEAERLPPLVFAVIVATVLLYGFGAGPLARRLGLSDRTTEGALILGAGRVETAIGEAIAGAGVPVLFATTNRRDESRVRLAGHRTFFGNLIDHEIPPDLDLSGIGRLLAVTPNDEVNTLATRRFAELFGSEGTYQIAAAPAAPGVDGTVAALGGRTLFNEDLTYREISRRLGRGVAIKSTPLSEDFGVSRFQSELLGEGNVLFLVRGHQLLVAAADVPRSLEERAQPGDVILWLGTVSD